MNRLRKTKKYLAIFSWILVLHLCSFLQLKGAPNLSQSGLFLNVMGTNGNFINDRKIVVLYLFVLVFSTSYLLSLIRKRWYKTNENKVLFQTNYQ